MPTLEGAGQKPAPQLDAPAGMVWVVTDVLADAVGFGAEARLPEGSVVVGNRALADDGRGKVTCYSLLRVGSAVAEIDDAVREMTDAGSPSTAAKGQTGEAGVGGLLRDRLGAPAEELQTGAVTHADERTLWIDMDEHGDRFKPWRVVVQETKERRWGKEWPFAGEPTCADLVRSIGRAAHDSRGWFTEWCREKGVMTGDRTFHEMQVLVEYLYYTCQVDQLNVGSLLGAEVIARRLQQHIEAYSRVEAGSPSKPDWTLAGLMGERRSSDIVSTSLRWQAQQSAREEAQLNAVRGGKGSNA